MSKSYYRIILGRLNSHAQTCWEGGFIGGDWGFPDDLSASLVDDWRQFNKEQIPNFLKRNPEKSKISAGLACGMLHTICKGIKEGDIVLSPDGKGTYMVGEVISPYFFEESDILPHRRKVKWFSQGVPRESMSLALKNSTGSVATVANITKYAEELSQLIQHDHGPQLIIDDEDVEDPAIFALEKHLEDFLVANWEKTELGKKYDIFTEEGELRGQQFPTDGGAIDILAVSKDTSELLVVELKKGRAGDKVVGQIQRYMGYVIEELAEEQQKVRGIIIALEDDKNIRRALTVASNIDFYRYKIDFKLIKG